MSVNIKYKNNSIATLTDTGTKTLKTSGKYCEADIIVENTKEASATEPYIEETFSSGALTTAVLHGYEVVRDYAFYQCEKLVNVQISDSVTVIGIRAFSGCQAFTSITLPNSVTRIKAYAFDNSGLLSITLPASITTIDDFALYRVPKMTSVTFMGTPSSIGQNTFLTCPALVTINVPWSQGAVPGAPWGATKATINYNYTGA